MKTRPSPARLVLITSMVRADVLPDSAA